MYKPNRFSGKDSDDLIRFVNSEFRRVSDALLALDIDTVDFKIWFELPPRPFEGTVAYIDSTADASITVTGLHEYVGGAWSKL